MKFQNPENDKNYIVANFDDVKIFEAATRIECENWIVKNDQDAEIYFWDGQDWVK